PIVAAPKLSPREIARDRSSVHNFPFVQGATLKFGFGESARSGCRPSCSEETGRMALDQRVVVFDRLGMADLAQVGGKNASLGEMIRHLTGEGVRVPGGFATTASAFHEFIEASNLGPRIEAAL